MYVFDGSKMYSFNKIKYVYVHFFHEILYALQIIAGMNETFKGGKVSVSLS